MINNYKVLKEKWERQDRKTKYQIYIAYVIFNCYKDSFLYETNDFSDLFIKVTQLVEPKATKQSMGGYINEFNKFDFTKSFGPQNNSNFAYHNQWNLTSLGAEFFFFMSDQILEYGKEYELDKLLPDYLKKYIPQVYLNS